jgi:membrane protease YdiL (CAAX protease family)
MTVSTLPAASPDVPAEDRAWGAWASIGWVIAAEGIRGAVDFAMDHSALPALAQHAYCWRVVLISLSWATPLAVLALAVRLRSSAFGPYVAWARPRLAWVAIALAVGLALQVAGHGLPYVLTGSVSDSFPIQDYRAHVAAGASPWRYVLLYWPAAIYAPLVEETTYRGFLWRGIAASRLGNAGALWLTSLFFALVHYRYFIQDGTFIPAAFAGPLIFGLAFGWIRRRSGSTIASMLAHSVANVALNVGTVLAVTLGWP